MQPDNKLVRANQKSINQLYDNKKPTLIYIHGWTFNYRNPGITLSFQSELSNSNVADYWIKAGWNVLGYIWIQYADDKNFARAECKIWSSRCDNKNIQWLDPDGTIYEHPIKESLTVRIGREFGEQFASRLSSDQELRILGHSMGTQLALSVTEEFHRLGYKKVDRLALTDLTSTRGAKDYLNGEWIGARARALASNYIARGGALENYRCWQISTTDIFDKNEEFDSSFFTIKRNLDYTGAGIIGALAQDARHWHCYHSYLWTISKQFVATGTDNDLHQFPAAAAPTALILKSHGKYVEQLKDSGAKTSTPFDDLYQIVK
jgi:pimeloyl-ACP methyl ester carboxylesterase